MVAHVHRPLRARARHRAQVGHSAHLRGRVRAAGDPRRARDAVADVDRLRHHARIRGRPGLLQRA